MILSSLRKTISRLTYCGKNSYIIVMYTAIYRICREVIDGVEDDYSDDEDTELPFD